MDALKTIFLVACPTILIIAMSAGLSVLPIGWADGHEVDGIVGIVIFFAFGMGLYGLAEKKRRNLWRNAEQSESRLGRTVAKYGYFVGGALLACWLVFQHFMFGGQ